MKLPTETKTVSVGGKPVVLEKRLCAGCKTPFWVTETSLQFFHSNQCGEDGVLANRHWKVQLREKRDAINKKRKEQAARDWALKLERKKIQIEKKVIEAEANASLKNNTQLKFKQKETFLWGVDWGKEVQPVKKKSEDAPDHVEYAECLTDCAQSSLEDASLSSIKSITEADSGQREHGDPLPASSTDDEHPRHSERSERQTQPHKPRSARENSDTTSHTSKSRAPGHESDGTGTLQSAAPSLTGDAMSKTKLREQNLTDSLGSGMQPTQKNSGEKNMSAGNSERSAQTKELSIPHVNTELVISASSSTIDECIEHLKTLLKSRVVGATGLDVPRTTVENINAVCNITKNIGNLVRLKLDVVKAMHSER